MAIRLRKASRHARQRWWDSTICRVEALREMRDKVLLDDEHVSVLNYTALLHGIAGYTACNYHGFKNT